MINYQIKQKMWSLAGKFDIKDEFGQIHYQVQGSFLQIPKEFVISDSQGRFVSRLKRVLWTFLPKFEVSLADGSSFIIRKEFTFFFPRYQIDHLGVSVEGDFWDLNFQLKKDGQTIAQINQEILRLTSTYNVAIYDQSYAGLVISLVIAIDYVKELDRAASS